MTTPLEDVAEAADQVADEQRRVARQARTMQRQRERGWSWERILDRGAAPGILAILRSSARGVGEALGLLSHTLAKGLASEGASRRGIAARLGVTHQRVSAMLKSGPRR